jgi:hypothetical protein
MGCEPWKNSTEDIQKNLGHWRMLSEDLEPKGAILSRRWEYKILGYSGRRFLVVLKELCYGKAETLEDAEEAARWWRYNLG